MIFIIILALLVIAVDQVPLSTPVDGTFTNLTNYTAGFVFQWQDTNEPSVEYANCTLYMAVGTPVGLVQNNQSFWFERVGNNTETTFYMNNTFQQDNTSTYWTIACENESSTPSIDFATPLVIYHNNGGEPTTREESRSFTNETWLTSTTVWYSNNVSGQENLRGEFYTCDIVNNSNLSQAAFAIDATSTNNSLVNLSWTPADGNYSTRSRCKNPYGTYNNSITTYSFFVDNTDPVAVYASGAPDDGSVQSDTFAIINMTITELNFDTANVTLAGTEYSLTVDNGNCTGTPPAIVCSYNFTDMTNELDKSFTTTVNDSAGNTDILATRTFTVDSEDPVINFVYNFSISASNITFIIAVNDTSPDTCFAYLYDRDGSLVGSSTGSYGTNAGGNNSNCTGVIQSTDIVAEGNFTVEYNVSDLADNNDTMNKTGVLKNLFSGWNLVSYSGSNETAPSEGRNLSDVCNEISTCTQVSIFSNSAKTFTTYSPSTPSVNSGGLINSSDPFHVYTTSDSFLLTDNYLNVSPAQDNVTLYLDGWNAIGIMKDSNISTVFNATSIGGTRNISWASQLDSSASTYYTCSRSLNLCAGTATLPTSLPLYEGYAVWILTDLVTNISINRSLITG